MLGLAPLSDAPISSLAPPTATASVALAGRTSAGSTGSGVLALATSTLALLGRSIAGGRGLASLTPGAALAGRTSAGGSGRGILFASLDLTASKLMGYAVTGPVPGKLSVPKMGGYAVTRNAPPGTLAVPKMGGYAVTRPTPTRLSASKLLGYAVIYPALPPPPVFPTLPVGFPVTVKPTFATVAGEIPAGRSMRAPLQTLPVWEFEMNFEELRDQTQNVEPYEELAGYTQLMQLSQLFIAAIGPFAQFLFDAWWDDSREDQEIAIGDGESGNFTMVRTWGFGGSEFVEPVGAVNVVTDVKIDGVVQDPSTYFIQGNRILTFLSAPGNGAVITSTFSYFYLCQFSGGEQEYTEFLKNRFTTKIQFRSVLQ